MDEMVDRIANQGAELNNWVRLHRRPDHQALWQKPLSTHLNIEQGLYFIENEKAAFYRMREAPTIRKIYLLLSSALELDEDQTTETRQAVVNIIQKTTSLISTACNEGKLDKSLLYRQ